VNYDPNSEIFKKLAWDDLDGNLHPESGKLGQKRAEDKTVQLENIQQVRRKERGEGGEKEGKREEERRRRREGGEKEEERRRRREGDQK
jgi:hypothetical protein